jgi:hypothetical protein
MNKAWFFGDSFTSGVGYNFEEFTDPDSNNYNLNINLDSEDDWETHPSISWCKDWKLRHQYQIWPYIVSSRLNVECKNKGEGGSCNTRILHKIIENLCNFKDGDYVFIGYTAPTRLLVPTGDSDPLMTTYLIKYPNINRNVPNNLMRTDSKSTVQRDDESIINFMYDHLYKNSNFIEKYEKSLYVKLIEFLNSRNINTLLWDYRWWDLFETIDTYTEGKIPDGHWSINGHLEFSKTIINAIQDKISILDISHFNGTHNINKSAI